MLIYENTNIHMTATIWANTGKKYIFGTSLIINDKVIVTEK